MEALRIQNLRSLVDTGFVDIKPITLLLGQNSSGKSTFLRAFPLFRQSVQMRTTGPILWYGQFVDLGSFADAKSLYTQDSEISFHFRFNLEADDASPRLIRLYGLRVIEDLEITLTLRLADDAKGEGNRTTECRICLYDNEIQLRFDNDGRVSGFFVNLFDLSDNAGELYNVQQSGLVPNLDRDRKSGEVGGGPEESPFFDLLLQQIDRHLHKNTSHTTKIAIARSLAIGSSGKMLEAMKNNKKATETWRRNAARWRTSSEDFQALRDLVIAYRISELLSLIDRYISAFAQKSSYIAPLRATAERYYRFQNLAVDEVDFQGKNLAMFLRNLTDTERKRFVEWTEDSFGFAFYSRASGGHTTLTLREKSGEELNLTDQGFGFSQILPIVTQLWMLSQRRNLYKYYYLYPIRKVPLVFAVEQPELHLHPRLQGKLADIFLASVKVAREAGVDLRLVIETHSETIVNRFGHRVAAKTISPEDINVVLFEKRDASAPTEMRFGKYDPEGFLTNWPLGFFDPEEV
jgi:predicted ATPase